MRRRPGVIGLVGLVAAGPVATWWLTGDLSEPGGYQRIVAPPELSERAALSTAVVSVAVLVASTTVVVAAWRDGQLDRRDGRAALPVLAAGVLAAVGARVLTAETVGANIGGGMVLLAGPFVLLPLLVAGARGWRRARRRS